MTITTQKQVIYVDNVPFEATLWFDESDDTVDIEAMGYVLSQYLDPRSSLENVFVACYGIDASNWGYAFEKAAQQAMSEV